MPVFVRAFNYFDFDFFKKVKEDIILSLYTGVYSGGLASLVVSCITTKYKRQSKM